MHASRWGCLLGGVVALGCTRPVSPVGSGRHDAPSAGGATVDAGLDAGTQALVANDAAGADASVPGDAVAPVAGWDAIRAAGGRWRRDPDCDYAGRCRAWLLAANVIDVDAGPRQTRIVIDLGAQQHVVSGMLGRVVVPTGGSPQPVFTIVSISKDRAVLSTAGHVVLASARLLLWDPTVGDPP